MIQNEDGLNEAQSRPSGTAVSNGEHKSMRKSLGTRNGRLRGTANTVASDPRDNAKTNSKRFRNKGSDAEALDQDFAASEPDNRSYKIGRFCNTMKVYQQFCSLTGVPPHPHHETNTFPGSTPDASTMGTQSMAGEGADPSRKATKLCLSFDKYSNRKDISEGEYSANEERFLHVPKISALSSNPQVHIGKYAARSAKSTAGDNFKVPIMGDGQGTFYDRRDNYDLITRNASGAWTAPSF